MNHEENQPVTVLATQDEALVAVAESLLQGSEIKYVVTNRIFQDLVGDGRIGTNSVAGAICVQVRPEDAEAAQAILSGLEPSRSSLRMSTRTRVIYLFLVFGLSLIFMVIRLIEWAIHR